MELAIVCSFGTAGYIYLVSVITISQGCISIDRKTLLGSFEDAIGAIVTINNIVITDSSSFKNKDWFGLVCSLVAGIDRVWSFIANRITLQNFLVIVSENDDLILVSVYLFSFGSSIASCCFDFSFIARMTFS